MQIKELPLDDLLLDPNNYRLQDTGGFYTIPIEKYALEQIQKNTRQKLKDEGLDSLTDSIRSNGFLPIERIVVTPYDYDDGKYLVVEGNRRVAALMGLREQARVGVDMHEGLSRVFGAVPCVVFEEGEYPHFRETLMGVRHVGGIREWGGYQRAKLIADLIDKHGVETNEVSSQLGLRLSEVNRRYRAFKALEQMEESEEFGEFADPSQYPLFHELMSSPITRNWVGWNDQTLSFDKSEQAEQFFMLISPREIEGQKAKKPKVRTYGDVREMKKIIPNSSALTMLLDESRTFLDALTVARKDELSSKWRSEIAEAATALEKIGALEVKSFKDEDVEALENIRDMAEQVLNIYNTVTAADG
ncbi:ParB N-terminal domain-containing protein [Aurantiacibacter odishensis]|uniref:ParB N-terminal domain-containing protein n=1 Tax=Aurantiacibacter odishensis TaxID=1155476 RepID=UPI000E72850E|nr:ParB N-terminal domain-containing protein [Aurantiacibacter odishensis]